MPKISPPFILWVGFVLVLVLVLAACQPAAPAMPADLAASTLTAVPPALTALLPATITPEPAVGSPGHPLKLILMPAAGAADVPAAGEKMAAALSAASGLSFEVSATDSDAAVIAALCASPADTIGFMPSTVYVLANRSCGVEAAFKAVQEGLGVYWAEFIVLRDSRIRSLRDLQGMKWGYGDTASTYGYMAPRVMLGELGIGVKKEVETGSHPQTVKAVYSGEVDFGTTFFRPPVKPEGETAWKEGDAPDVSGDLASSCELSGDLNDILCGGWNMRDGRRNIRLEAPDVIEKVRILALSPAIPNDTISFGVDFPPDLKDRVGRAFEEYSRTGDWKNSFGRNSFYGWEGLLPAVDKEYDFVRKMVDAAGITLDNYGNQEP